jgi:RNA polymerase sigma factor for flagellar operon FliA
MAGGWLVGELLSWPGWPDRAIRHSRHGGCCAAPTSFVRFLLKSRDSAFRCSVVISDSSSTSRTAEQIDQLVREHLPLVGYIVRETLSRVPGHVHRDDLASAGMYALVVAAQRYDDSRGIPFNRYVTTRIRGAIMDELRGMDWASRSVRRRARELDDIRSQLGTKLGRTPTDAEVAQALGVGVDELTANQQDVSRAMVASLQEVQEAGAEGLLPSGGPAPHEIVEHRERVGYLHDAVAKLPERLRTVVEGSFFAERPMTEIAEELGVSESRVSQMRTEALSLLKGALNTALDPQLVEEHPNPNGAAARRRNAYYAEVASHRSFASRLAGEKVPAQTA